MAFPNMFGALTGPIPTSKLDENFSALSDTAAATKGAGLVGYNSALSYAAGTVGAKIKELEITSIAQGPRDVVRYASASSVVVSRRYATMGGFRFHGQYLNSNAPTFEMPSNRVASTTSNLGAESSARTENWYAVFACANSGDSVASLKVMPFLRVGTPSGSNLPLIKAGENVHALTGTTYSWSAANNLAGKDCLVISENGSFSGRLTTFTANSSSQVTLASVGSIAAYDFLLPAPPGYSYYCYLGSFYFDTAEVRNIYDTGSLVKAKMIYIIQPSASLSGSVPSPVAFNAAGYICPLATGIVLDSSCVLSTASTGDYAEYFDPDGSNHIVQSFYTRKENASSASVVFSGATVPFLYHQKFYYNNAGSLAASRINGQSNITGWYEP